VGRLEPYKRADLAIDAVAGLRRRRPGLRLIVLGSGSAKSSLEKMVERRGLAGTVFFKGFIDEQEKVRWLQRSDVLVHTSEKEGWGMTVIEAAACGTPSVAPDVAGLRDSISDGRTGLLVPFGDSRALEDALDAVLGDGDLRASLTAGCREWAGRFDWEQVADDTVMLIEQALGPTATGPRLSSSPFGA
jgi:glycosyltransferase involved in cell wall biosynthesis